MSLSCSDIILTCSELMLFWIKIIIQEEKLIHIEAGTVKKSVLHLVLSLSYLCTMGRNIGFRGINDMGNWVLEINIVYRF